MTPAPRTLRVKCSTWDQVETFYVRKLRRGRTVTIRVPFVPEPDEPLSVALELPNDLVVVVDGTITSVQTAGDGRASIDIDLHGLSAEVIDRLETLVKDGRNPEAKTPKPAASEQSAVAEAPVSRSDDPAYAVVVQLDGELRRLRQLAVHEVIGVPYDASAVEVRAAWRALCLRFHPDALAAHRSAAVTHLGEELMILVNRAYDRMRASLVAEGRATAPGPALRPDKGWLVGFEALGTSELAITGLAAMATRGTGMTHLPPMGPPSPDPVKVPIAVAPRPAPAAELPSVPAPPRRRKAPTTGQPSVRFEQSTEHVFDELAVGTKAEASLDVARANAGDVFEKQARARIAAGDHVAAREVLAAALYVYPRNQMLRALYHVAAAMEALDAGLKEHAVAQLEAAMTADASCREASSALDDLRRGRAAPGDVGRWFR